MKFLFLLLLSVSLYGCAGGLKGSHSLGGPLYYAKVKVYGANSGRVLGTLKFSEAFGKVKLMGQVKGLLSNHEHGISIYKFGDCSNTGRRYGAIGRLGNIKSNKKSVANIEMEIEGLSINTGQHPIVGRSLVIHQHKDDMVSKGHGGAGLKIACGVIGASSK